ncbi:hypothetical protein [Pelagicoccus sp. SDUM812002]|uniref:hypothetical protein n=1 Tax=Pelagicoccus sp. SDUM812002 TaxID=3041266 RepID=UPI00280E0359|nr:hypothetical protein [Pelagicoccus sp. SDUM812002]MDQ8188514.1 hypothetical protein [Pelagicoccus sp. SDUM812002]
MIPDSYEQDFRIVDSKVYRLHKDWNSFRNLFDVQSPNIPLYNKNSAEFFEAWRFMYLGTLCVRACQLLDPHYQGKNKNLTLFTFYDDATFLTDSQRSSLKEMINKLKSDSSKFIDLRNKLFAHSDYEIAQQQGGTLYSFSDFESFLSELRTIMRTIRNYLGHCDRKYEEAKLGDNGQSVVEGLELLTQTNS